MTTKKLIGTHSGTFHADEALAVYLVKTLKQYKDADLVRTRDPAVLSTCDIVVDVGGVYDPSIHRYDHHQRSFNSTYSPSYLTKLSSAGLIYKHFGEEIVTELLQLHGQPEKVKILQEKLYESFVEGLDGIDNGVEMYSIDWAGERPEDGQPPEKKIKLDGPQPKVKRNYKSSTDLSSRIGKLNPAWNVKSTSQDQDNLFLKASELAGSEFVDALHGLHNSWLPAREIVEKGFKARKNGIVELETFAPWKDHLSTLEEEANDFSTLYILYPEDGPNWRVQAVSKEEGSFESRKALPEPWRGIRDDDLSKLTGIDGCIFVHASGFIGGNKTREGALMMAEKAVTI